MSWASAEQVLLEASKSPELAAALQTVGDAEIGRVAKFPLRACRDLARVVVCRNYGPAVLELCHLIVAAEACGREPQRYEDFFWDSGPATAAGFRAYLNRGSARGRPGRDTLTVTGAGVEIAYPDGGFAITYARMPFLSALMEFLITAIGYAELDDLCRSLFTAGPTKARVSASANALSKKIYGYLTHHLTSAQSQRKFVCLVAFLKARGHGDFGPEAIDDAAVLEFWLTRTESEAARNADFKMFLSAFRAFVRLRQALEEARDLEALSGPRSIGSDREAGEVDPAQVQHLVETVQEADNPLAALARPPASGVKFLTKTEAAALDLLVDCGKAAWALPLSLLRCEAFGPSQARISQALRRKTGRAALRALIRDGAGQSYLDRQAGFRHLAGHLERVLLAALHALVRARRSEALTLVMELGPEIDLQPLAKVLVTSGADGKVVPLQGAAFRERLMDALEDPEASGPQLAALMAQAGKAFRSLTRQGFREADVARPDGIEGVAAGTQAVIGLKRHLEDFRQALRRTRLAAGDWERQFETDRETFRAQFVILYGEAL